MRHVDEKFSYVQHMHAEHQRLDQLISRTLTNFPSWEEIDLPSWLPRMIEGLKRIRGELAHHFHDEEQGGCLEEAVARCPALSANVQAIEAEHMQLLAELDALIRRRWSSTTLNAAEAQAIEADLQALVRNLRAHESLENCIIQRAFGVCLDDKEAGVSASST